MFCSSMVAAFHDAPVVDAKRFLINRLVDLVPVRFSVAACPLLPSHAFYGFLLLFTLVLGVASLYTTLFFVQSLFLSPFRLGNLNVATLCPVPGDRFLGFFQPNSALLKLRLWVVPNLSL